MTSSSEIEKKSKISWTQKTFVFQKRTRKYLKVRQEKSISLEEQRSRETTFCFINQILLTCLRKFLQKKKVHSRNQKETVRLFVTIGHEPE
jgi:hypothetical protein